MRSNFRGNERMVPHIRVHLLDVRFCWVVYLEKKVKVMSKFESNVQYIKYLVNRECASRFFNGELDKEINMEKEIAEAIIPGPKASFRCCIYKERAIINSLYIDPSALEKHVNKLYAKYAVMEQNECRWQEELTEDADYVLVAYGTTARIARSAMRKLRDKGIKAGLIRPITLWPFPVKNIQAACKSAKAFLAVEMSMGQMVDDVRLAVNGEHPVHFFGRTGGIIPSPAEVLAKIEEISGGAK